MQETVNPTNINAARRQAACFAKAKTMTAAGYELLTIGGYKDLFVVKSAEGNEYGVDLQFSKCDCPDFVKHGGTCKHLIWAGMRLDEAEEAAMWEAACAQYDEEEGWMNDILDGYAPKTTTLQFLESVQARMCSDLNKARELASVYKIGVKDIRAERVHQLETALLVIGEYWGKELCGRLDLQPADTVKL